MIKKVITMFTIIFVLLSNQTFAHTVLENSTPKDGEVVKEPLQQITLNFATKVEETSTIEVSRSNGELVNLGNFVIDENEMWATFLQPLKNDDYKVVWKIVGADGHPIEGEFSFTVDTPTDETPKQEEKVENTSLIEDSQKEQKEEVDTDEKTEESTQKEQNLPTFLISSVVVGFLIVGIGFFWWIIRRK